MERDEKDLNREMLEQGAEFGETQARMIRKAVRKRQQKKRYAKAFRENRKSAKAGEQVIKGVTEKTQTFVRNHREGLVMLLVFLMFLLVILAFASSCSLIFTGTGEALAGSSYLARDEVILEAEATYQALERNLRQRVERIEEEKPGYAEYRITECEIGHDPYALAAILTVTCEDYQEGDVHAVMEALFDAQYDMQTEVTKEMRTRTVTKTGIRVMVDAMTGEEREETYEYEETERYEVSILEVAVVNHGMSKAVASYGLSKDEMARYGLLTATKGNRSYLFADNVYAAGTGTFTDHDIPAAYLTDVAFANLIREAEKYLGYPYVWGGSSPETSFDCSGYVCWVLNHCGNGWDVGRTTANGLLRLCERVPEAQARPGDLVFFEGTYDTSGASHVGIYVGDGWFLHCGNPISYAALESSYWKAHFLCFGRLRG